MHFFLFSFQNIFNMNSRGRFPDQLLDYYRFLVLENHPLYSDPDFFLFSVFSRFPFFELQFSGVVLIYCSTNNKLCPTRKKQILFSWDVGKNVLKKVLFLVHTQKNTVITATSTKRRNGRRRCDGKLSRRRRWWKRLLF